MGKRPLSWRSWLVHGALVLGAVVASVPFLWTALTSVMTRSETLRKVFVPSELQWENYRAAWHEADFGLYFENSLIIAALTVLGTLLFSLMAKEALSHKWQGV